MARFSFFAAQVGTVSRPAEQAKKTKADRKPADCYTAASCHSDYFAWMARHNHMQSQRSMCLLPRALQTNAAQYIYTAVSKLSTVIPLSGLSNLTVPPKLEDLPLGGYTSDFESKATQELWDAYGTWAQVCAHEICPRMPPDKQERPWLCTCVHGFRM